jgi:diguanylate cyclase (GGDEF)-like protein
MFYELNLLRENNINNAKKSLKHISESTSFAVYNLDIGSAEAILRGLENEHIFTEIVIYDEFKDVIATTNSQKDKGKNSGYFQFINKLEIIVEPLYVHDPEGSTLQLIGNIEARINSNISKESAWGLTKSIVGYSLIYTILFVAFVYLFFEILVDIPISFLIKKMSNFENRIQNKKIVLPNRYRIKEYQYLADAYNKSVDEIADTLDKLEKKTELMRSLISIDPLTEAWNRRALTEKLEEITKIKYPENLVVLAVDLDNFSDINDLYGHAVGDQVLKLTYDKIKERLPSNVYISRTGGDEFIVLVEISKDYTLPKLLVHLEHLIRIIPDRLLTNHKFISLSIGYSIYPQQAININQAITYADLALYSSKYKGKKTITCFDIRMLEKANLRISNRLKLDEIIEHSSFYVYYQPKINLLNKEIIGCEALLRLPDNLRESPASILCVAESTGLIIQLGLQILERAMAEISQILPHVCEEFRLSVNVSTKEFLNPSFCESLAVISKRTSFPLSKLDIEITESTQLSYGEKTHIIKEWLHQKGCTLTLDDFGTGFASLEYLLLVGFDQIKIDKGFIKELLTDEKSQKIVRVVQNLAIELDMTVVAEGVERVEQEEWLKLEGISYSQGFLYSQAVPVERFSKLMTL